MSTQKKFPATDKPAELSNDLSDHSSNNTSANNSANSDAPDNNAKAAILKELDCLKTMLDNRTEGIAEILDSATNDDDYPELPDAYLDTDLPHNAANDDIPTLYDDKPNSKNGAQEVKSLPLNQDQIKALLANPKLLEQLSQEANILIQELVDDYISDIEIKLRNRLEQKLEQILKNSLQTRN